MRTKVKILQHNRLDANRFVSVKLRKQTKTAPIFLRCPIKILATEMVLVADGKTGSTGMFLLGLYRIADFTVRPNKNNSFYYSAEYE